MYPKARASSPEVQETRRVLLLVRPFIARLGRWNQRLPWHLAVLSSPRSSGLARSSAFAALDEMLGEVHEAQSAFAEATASAPTHGRVEDMRYSMSRLEVRLAQVLAATAAPSSTPRPAVPRAPAGVLRP